MLRFHPQTPQEARTAKPGATLVPLSLPITFVIECDEVRDTANMFAAQFHGCHSVADYVYRGLAMSGTDFKALEFQCFFVAGLAFSICWSLWSLRKDTRKT